MFTVIRSTEEAARLYPSGLATATPQTFTVASQRSNRKPAGSSPPHRSNSGTRRTRPRSARFELVQMEGRNNTGSSRTPFRLARRARTIWQYWPAPALSGLLPPSPASPGQAAPSFTPPLRRSGGGGLSPPLEPTAPRGANRLLDSPERLGGLLREYQQVA